MNLTWRSRLGLPGCLSINKFSDYFYSPVLSFFISFPECLALKLEILLGR